MNRKRLMLRVLTVLVGITMTSSLIGCSKAQETNSDNTKKEEPITIKMLFKAGSDWNNFQDSPVQKDLKEKTGVNLEIVSSDESKYNVLLASGDLPDIIRTDTTIMNKLIEGGTVIPMDDLLQTHGKDIVKSIPDTIAFSKKFWSNNTNKTYFLPAEVGTAKGKNGLQPGVGPTIRWDYYKELGYPEIKSTDDLLNVLKDMVAKHPTTEDGKKVYGVSGFIDWGNWIYYLPMASILGYNNTGNSALIKADTNEITSLFTDTEAAFWKTVEFYYKANKLGIYDPDALTMKYDDFTAKATAGQILFGPADWAMGDFNSKYAKDGKGYIGLPLDWGFQWGGDVAIAGWSDKCYGITKNSQSPEKAMDVMNYLWSYDGARTLHSGVKGTHWDIVDGKAKLKDSTVAMKAAGGDEWKNSGIQKDANLIGLAGDVINPADSSPMDLFGTSEIFEGLLNNLQKDFSTKYGVKYPGELFDKKIESGVNKNRSELDTIALAALPSLPDDMKRIDAKLVDIALKAAPKCILSKSDAEFEANKKSALEEFKAAGNDTIMEWYKNAWEEARTQSKSVK